VVEILLRRYKVSHTRLSVRLVPSADSRHAFRSGQISASLAGMSRTIDDYDSMARREIIKAKQEKATSYVQRQEPTPHSFHRFPGECRSSRATLLSFAKNLSA
jgi:hypothetical protein